MHRLPSATPHHPLPSMRSYPAVLFALIVALVAIGAHAQVPPSYGNDPAAGGYVEVAGARLYYEAYGTGAPLVLLHGNSGSIAYMAPQIAYFAAKYHVIVPDCRGRGKSELGSDSLTYLQMARDVDALLEHLHVDSAYVIGRSDGAIIALMLGIHYPQRVRRIAAFGANATPDTMALYPRTYAHILAERRKADVMLAAHDTTQNWRLVQQRFRLMEFQPHLTAADLARIQCPTLILSADRDVIREEHTLFLYRSIPRANLCIFPGATHRITKLDPQLFNTTVDAYFTAPFHGDDYRGE